jgi:hypothetical protein
MGRFVFWYYAFWAVIVTAFVGVCYYRCQSVNEGLEAKLTFYGGCYVKEGERWVVSKRYGDLF